MDLSDEYEQTLSSGTYKLRSVFCRGCCLYLGWMYAAAEDRNKEREGTFMYVR